MTWFEKRREARFVVKEPQIVKIVVVLAARINDDAKRESATLASSGGEDESMGDRKARARDLVFTKVEGCGSLRLDEDEALRGVVCQAGTMFVEMVAEGRCGVLVHTSPDAVR